MRKLLLLLNFLLATCVLSCKTNANNKQKESDTMKIAAIYDIHANPVALKAVLNDIEKIKVDLIIVGGDVVSGPMANETLSLLEKVTTPKKYILGNAELEVLRYLNGEEINGLSERANEEARWVSEQLTPKHKNLIRSWTKTELIELRGLGNVVFCHGTPRSDVEIFTKLTSKEKLLSIFEKVDASIVICGHTHMQFDLKVGNTRVINAGSVGMAFGKTGADWLLIDNEIHFKHTVYDLEKAAELVRKSNYPHAESFVLNNILETPSEDNALQMLTKMEKNQNIKTN